MGIVTNIVLELVLVCRVHLLKGVPGGPSPRTLKILRWAVGCQLFIVTFCVEINQCAGCTQQFFTKSFLGDDAAILALSSGEEPASPRHRSSRRRVDGVEDDAMIQHEHERAVKF